MLEMNPICLVQDDACCPVRALDLVGEVDDTAQFKCSKMWGGGFCIMDPEL